MGNSIAHTVTTFGSSYFCYLEAIEANGIDEGVLTCLTQDEFNNDLLSIIGVTNIIHKIKFQKEFEKFLLNKNKLNDNIATNDTIITNDSSTSNDIPNDTLPSAPPLVGIEVDPTPAIPSNYLKRSESMMNQIECSLCLCSMVDPCTLNCGHSSCIDCLREGIKKRYTTCSVCRQEYLESEKKDNGKDLKINISLRNLVDRIDPDRAQVLKDQAEKKKILELEKKQTITDKENKKINGIMNTILEAKRLGGTFVEKKDYATVVGSYKGKYTGQWNGSHAHGVGVMEYSEGSVFYGQWKNGKIHGLGNYYYSSGATYDGSYIDEKRHGYGVYSYSNGDSYFGHYNMGSFEGEGNYNYHTGDKYTGSYKNGKWDGYGEYIYHIGDRYIGHYKEGKFCGEGRYEYSSGSLYVGGYKEGKWHGFGTYNYNNGDKYTGNYFEAKFNGAGRYEYASGSNYEGNYKGGKWHGHGVYCYASGDKYVGDYINGKFDGKGQYDYNNGDVYKGEYKDNKMHGTGVYTYANGNIWHSGKWKDGERVKKTGFFS
jgi:hypothetical protein